MRMSRFILITLCVCVGMLSGPGRASAKAAAANELPGKEIAQHISLLTGVALSPLMGVSGVGAWQYFKAKTPEQKAKLAWFANPWFFIPALLLVIVCFVKDTAGAALPTAVKKPFDIAETVENKISGLVATGAFVPIAAAIFHAKGGGDGAALSGLGFAAIDLSWFYNALMVPISMAAFFVVFLASNAINVLIILSPFTVVDAALKGFRLALLGTVGATALANPWIGAAWALVLILIAYLIAGWSFRLSHFGMVLTWDFFTFRSSRFTPNPDGEQAVPRPQDHESSRPHLRQTQPGRKGQPGFEIPSLARVAGTHAGIAGGQILRRQGGVVLRNPGTPRRTPRKPRSCCRRAIAGTRKNWPASTG